MVDRLLGRTREAPPPEPVPIGPTDPRAAVWARVQQARNLRRPRTLGLVGAMAEGFIEIHRDGLFRDDPAIVIGFARIHARRWFVIGQQKGVQHRGKPSGAAFGMPQSGGNSAKAMRGKETSSNVSGMPGRDLP